jgi:glutaredoxin
MAWDWQFWQRWLGGRKSLRHWRIVVYTRRGCHLCECAEEALRRAQRRYGFALEEADVDGTADLLERYGEMVPVVTVNGKVRFRGGVNAALLERLLRAGMRQSTDDA